MKRTSRRGQQGATLKFSLPSILRCFLSSPPVRPWLGLQTLPKTLLNLLMLSSFSLFLSLSLSFSSSLFLFFLFLFWFSGSSFLIHGLLVAAADALVRRVDGRARVLGARARHQRHQRRHPRPQHAALPQLDDKVCVGSTCAS